MERVHVFFVGMLLLIGFPCLAASDKAFTATESLCYSCVCPTCDPGEMTVLDGGNLQLRNREVIYFYTASDQHAAGYFRVRLNIDSNPAFNGAMWGTFYSCDLSGNRITDGWEGTLNGTIFAAFPTNSIYRATAYGTGAKNGLRMEFTAVYGDSLTGTVVGMIQDARK